MRNTLTAWQGASVELFQNDLLPYGNTISILPGTETKIGVRKKVYKTEFKKEPYLSRCTDDWQDVPGRMLMASLIFLLQI